MCIRSTVRLISLYKDNKLKLSADYDERLELHSLVYIFGFFFLTKENDSTE